MVVRGFYEDEDVPEGFEPLLADEDDPDSEQLGRTVEIRHVFRYDTNGHEILGKPKPWAGKYIPIVPVYGEEKVVEGKTILESAIRFALDPQQLYNFYKTTEAEVVQQTPKNPYIGVLGQFKTMQMQWAEANRTPRAYLEYDPVSGRRAARAAAAAAGLRARDAGAHDRRGRGERGHQSDDGPLRSVARRRVAERRFGFCDRSPAAAGRDRDLSLFRQLHALDVVWLSHSRRSDSAHL